MCDHFKLARSHACLFSALYSGIAPPIASLDRHSACVLQVLHHRNCQFRSNMLFLEAFSQWAVVEEQLSFSRISYLLQKISLWKGTGPLLALLPCKGSAVLKLPLNSCSSSGQVIPLLIIATQLYKWTTCSFHFPLEQHRASGNLWTLS